MGIGIDALVMKVGVPVEFTRSARNKRPSMRLDVRSGAARIALPRGARNQSAIPLLREHGDWLRAAVSTLPALTPFEIGATIPVRGKPVTIRRDLSTAGARLRRGLDGMELAVGAGDVEAAVLAWLSADVLRSMTQASRRKAASIGREVASVRLEDRKSRWGVCCDQGHIGYSWRLAMAPAFVRDYMAAHEVAHLVDMGHGAAFWQLCDCLCRNRSRAGRRWLHDNEARLTRTGPA